MTTVSITAAPKFQTANDVGDYLERTVTVQIGDDSITRDMCDPDDGWDSSDMWLSDKHYNALRVAGASPERAIEIMREAWHQATGVAWRYWIG